MRVHSVGETTQVVEWWPGVPDRLWKRVPSVAQWGALSSVGQRGTLAARCGTFWSEAHWGAFFECGTMWNVGGTTWHVLERSARDQYIDEFGNRPERLAVIARA